MADLKIVMTLMVRDEADIIAAMIEHHLSQGVDLIIATDNGSVDGTREILADYAASGRVEVHDYLAHDKNQTGVVSEMASRAASEHAATWVINADADEFFIAKDPRLTLRDALSRIPTSIGSFPVPVVNLTGVPARSGAWIRRLTQRDVREESTLMSTVALHAHPTADVVHVGRVGVTVQQGNHGVDIPSLGTPDARFALEVLHVPWRTYSQYETKVINTGRAYDANPLLNPSPRHHGMRDYRFWKAGVLESLYLVRHPGQHRGSSEVPSEGFASETRLETTLAELLQSGRAIVPGRLEPLLAAPGDQYTIAERHSAEAIAGVVIPLEIEHIDASTRWRDLYRAEAAQRRRAESEREHAESVVSRLRARPEARLRALVRRALDAPRALASRGVRAFRSSGGAGGA